MELSSRWWRGELGMGSRRLGWAGGGGGSGGCPLPVPATPMPAASRALRLGELLNRLAAVFSFFLFCYTDKKAGARGSSMEKIKNKIITKDTMEWKEKRKRAELGELQSL